MHTVEEYFKKIFRFHHIFAIKLSSKVLTTAMPNKDNPESLSLDPEQGVMSLQESSTRSPCQFHCISIQTRSFFGLFMPKK